MTPFLAHSSFGARKSARSPTSRSRCSKNFAAQAVIAIENARLLGELQQRTGDLQESLEYQTATSDVLKVIGRSSFDIQPVFETIAATAGRLCDADTSIIRKHEGEAYRVAATFSVSTEFDAFARGQLLLASRGSIAGQTALEGRIVHIHDIASDPEYTVTEAVTLAKARTMLGVPLLREGAVVGTIALGRQRVQPFTERQIELVRTFADQAVIALENARLLGELQQRTDELAARNSEFGERIEHQAATIDVLKAMSASPGDPQPVFDLIVRRARDLCNTTTATLYEFDGELVHLRSMVRRRGIRHARRRWKPTGGCFRWCRRAVPSACRAILDRQTIHVRDMATVPGVSAAVRNLGYKSQIALPLLRDGAAIGAVSLTSGEIGGFTDSQVALLQTFAEQAVIAITSAETYRELQQRTRDLEESLEYQTATSDVLKVISRSASDVQPVLDTVTETAARLCAADSGNGLFTRGRGLPPCVESVRRQNGTRVLGDPAPANSLSPVATASSRGRRSKAGSCMLRTSSPTRTTRRPRLQRPGDAPSLECRCCARGPCSARLVSRGNG